MVRYNTYSNNDFGSTAFAETKDRAEELKASLLKLKHVSKAEIIDMESGE